MFNFSHLRFAEHPRYDFVQLAQMSMSDKYGISVAQGEQTFGNVKNNTYEVAIFDRNFTKIIYNLPLKDEKGIPLKTSGVISYVSVDTVSAIMYQLQEGLDE